MAEELSHSWSAEVAAEAGIGPRHPMHPDHAKLVAAEAAAGAATGMEGFESIPSANADDNAWRRRPIIVELPEEHI